VTLRRALDPPLPETLAAPDFPTTIIETPLEVASPLLSAFTAREGFLAAFVLSEVLAPPIGLR